MRKFLEKHIQNKVLLEIVDWGISIAFTVAFGLFFVFFIAKISFVSGISMMPTLQDGDVLIIDQVSYRFSEPKANDIVVFPYEPNPKKHYVKRVIALPGDTVDLVDGVFYINDKKLEDDFLNEGLYLHSTEFPLIVPEKTVFVLGDNRDHSDDSRYNEVGCIPYDKLMGKSLLRIYPFSTFGTVK